MSDVDPRFEPEFQRGYDPSRHKPSRRPKSAAPEPVIEVIHVDQPESDDSLESARRRHNPFLIVLPVLGVVLLATAIYLIARLADSYRLMISGPMSSDTSAWSSISTAIMPAAVVGSVLSFTIWFALLALIPRRADA